MSDSIQIGRVSWERLELVVPLFDKYRQFYKQSTDLAGAEAFLQERLRREESVIFLALDSDAGVGAGFTQLYPTFSSISMRKQWILNDLFVSEEYRGQRIGRRLLEASKQHAIETNAVGLSLSTAVDNFTAQKLYESFGYQKDNDFYNYDLMI
jgi:ribosomal protein S18 acetylase RimI-like enzyme